MRNLLRFASLGTVITLGGCTSSGDNGSPNIAGAASVAGNGSGGGSSPMAGNNPGGSSSSGSSAGGTSGTSAGGATNTGGTPAAGSGAGGEPPLPATLVDRIHVSEVEVSAGVKKGVSNWRIWGRGDLNVAPVFTAPLPSCETLVCFTSGTADAPTSHVVKLDATDKLAGELVSATGVECRGLAAGESGQFAALLWKGGDDTIAVTRYDAAGAPLGSTPLANADNHPTDFDIGEARLEYGQGKYGAYYHVHSDSGHEGDTLKWVDAASGAEKTEWSWGCSHSMSNLLRFHPTLDAFLPACVTDCYPGTGSGDFKAVSLGGIYLNHDDKKIMDVDAGCNGSVAGELGGAALAPDGYKLVFNAHQAPAGLGQSSYDKNSMNQDIGFASVAKNLTPSKVVWLTTSSANEADASISHYQATAGADQYLVGWAETTKPQIYKLALLDASGAFLESPVDVSTRVAWGRRDDPFREHFNGDVIWTWFDTPGSTKLRIARVDSAASNECKQ